MRFIFTLLFCLLLLGFIGLVFIYSGFYNVTATEPHTEPVAWVLETTKRRSVATRADNIEVPALFTEDQIRHGYVHYMAMCVMCHGAPGVEQTELAQGLRPAAPPVRDMVPEWTSAELFWVVKYGIRMTGMPAWGVTHDDDELWSIVAFMERLPQLTVEQFQQLQAELADEAVDHHYH
ncbi:MAG: c-type cytochrome [Pseudomonadales bacterium]